MKKYILRPGMIEVYQEVINRPYQSQNKEQREDLKSIKLELEQVNNRLVKARDLLLADELNAADYKETIDLEKSFRS